jgi:uncharacterized protein
MYYNVSQLLKESVGSTRTYDVSGSFTLDGLEARLAPRGRVSMMRTDRGIWVDVGVDVQSQATCSRCLERFTYYSKLVMGEEYLPAVDVATGRPLDTRSAGEDVFTIDQRHCLDLREALEEYAITNQPMKPLCSEACGGLCSICGARRNAGGCGSCEEDPANSGWGPLAGLLSLNGR